MSVLAIGARPGDCEIGRGGALALRADADDPATIADDYFTSYGFQG